MVYLDPWVYASPVRAVGSVTEAGSHRAAEGGDGAGIVYGAAGYRQPAGWHLRGPVTLEADDDRKRPDPRRAGAGACVRARPVLDSMRQGFGFIFKHSRSPCAPRLARA